MTSAKILLVEDDEELLMGLTIRLKHSGYQVVTAVDGYSAISVARKEVPDIIILDIGLPAGDGFSVMSRLKEVMPVHIPVIVLSGRDPSETVERACLNGAEAFFQKPADNSELIDEIERIMQVSERRSA